MEDYSSFSMNKFLADPALDKLLDEIEAEFALKAVTKDSAEKSELDEIFQILDDEYNKV